MTASEIAVQIVAGNVAVAREGILNANDRPASPQPYASAALTLDVVREVALLRVDRGTDEYPDFQTAGRIVRDCLEGIT